MFDLTDWLALGHEDLRNRIASDMNGAWGISLEFVQGFMEVCFDIFGELDRVVLIPNLCGVYQQ